MDVIRFPKDYPRDYKIGWVDFINVKIDLSLKPLIPRTETEYWVWKEIKNLKPESKILDIFCGSGCIGIAILKNVPGSTCTFADLNDNTLKQTQLNLNLNKVDQKRYKIVKSDIFE